MHPYLFFIIGLTATCILALWVGRFLGISNKRCYAKESNQGRLRLDDCDLIQCHKAGECKYRPTISQAE